jgi:hypothetical protein
MKQNPKRATIVVILCAAAAIAAVLGVTGAFRRRSLVATTLAGKQELVAFLYGNRPGVIYEIEGQTLRERGRIDFGIENTYPYGVTARASPNGDFVSVIVREDNEAFSLVLSERNRAVERVEIVNKSPSVNCLVDTTATAKWLSDHIWLDDTRLLYLISWNSRCANGPPERVGTSELWLFDTKNKSKASFAIVDADEFIGFGSPQTLYLYSRKLMADATTAVSVIDLRTMNISQILPSRTPDLAGAQSQVIWPYSASIKRGAFGENPVLRFMNGAKYVGRADEYRIAEIYEFDLINQTMLRDFPIRRWPNVDYERFMLTSPELPDRHVDTAGVDTFRLVTHPRNLDARLVFVDAEGNVVEFNELGERMATWKLPL